MKRKILALFLVFVLLFTTVASGFTVSATEVENLIANGNFEEYENNVPTNWKLDLRDNTTAEIVDDVQIAEGVTSNAIKLTTTVDNAGSRSNIYMTSPVQIQKNATYTTTFWLKIKNIEALRTYMYEPAYVDLNGVSQTKEIALEGQNIYSFSYNNNTRVIRTDINHAFKIAATDTIIDMSGPSMFIARKNGNGVVLASDYPSSENQGEWFQVVHTFETGNNDDHEAEICYQFTVPEAVDGEFWVADVKMTVEAEGIIDYYTPAINDVALGCVSPAGAIPIYSNTETILTAAPFGENTFDGWYNGDQLVTTDAVLKFNYEEGVTPVYEARFTKGEFGIDGSYESSTVGKVASAAHFDHVDNWTEDGFKTGSLDGIHFVDSSSSGTWRAAAVTTDKAHTGTKSLKFDGQYGNIGRKITGLSKNTNYVLSFYAYINSTNSDSKISGIIVTDTDHSHVVKNDAGSLINRPEEDPAVLYRDFSQKIFADEWKQFQVEFNTKDNEEVIIWVNSSGTEADLYLDNFAIARGESDYTPTVNDATLGFVNSIRIKDGTQATIIATPLGESVFDGWYDGDTLVSADNEYTFTFSASTTPVYEARFTGSGFGIDGGYESGTLNSVVAQEVTYPAGTYTDDVFLGSSKDGMHYVASAYNNNWRKASVTNKVAHSGKQSLHFAGQYGFVGRKFTGLTKNTDYAISVYAYLTYTPSSDAHGISNIMVTNTSTSPIIKSESGALVTRSETNAGVLAKKAGVDPAPANGWTKCELIFNSGDNEEVIMWCGSSGTGAALYLDDYAINRMVEINIESSRKGTVKTDANAVKVPYGLKVTATATPYEGNTLAGLYINDTLVSNDAEYTFIADGNKTIRAEFEGENTPAFEYFETIGMDGTFENGTISGWTFSDPQYGSEWCSAIRGNANAYEGDYSLAFFSRHRNSILKLDNLYPHTRYTLSFYFKQSTTGDKEHISPSAITTTDINHLGEDTVAIATTDTILFTGEWQKYEISFNSGNNEAVNFILRYASESGTEKLYVDNFSLMVGQYEDHAYDNACDTTCNYCGEVREITHDYKTEWDADGENHWHQCSVCGDKIDVDVHVYDNDCDSTCNVCNYEREAGHPYEEEWSSDESNHWHECAACDDKGDLAPHSYDNACDTTCNDCGYVREVPGHVYDNDDDRFCNECGYSKPLFTPGNIDNDANNTVDLQDVVALAQVVAGWEGVTHNPAALDVNGDGEVDLQDVVHLAQFVAGWDVELSGSAEANTDVEINAGEIIK